jgi:hypothetical protein
LVVKRDAWIGGLVDWWVAGLVDYEFWPPLVTPSVGEEPIAMGGWPFFE